MRHVIENVRFIQDGTLVFGDIHMEDGFVERMDYKTIKGVCDLAVPGFIDIHVHGFRGYRAECKDPKQLKEMAMEMARRGITGFCPALTPMPFDELKEHMEAYRQAFSTQYPGARFLGVHLEGPYLSKKKPGAIPVDTLREIDLNELEEFLKIYHEDIAIMTLAPEVDHALEAIDVLERYKVIVSMGHSASSYDECRKAIMQGASHATHLGNAMDDLHHRLAGMQDAIFDSDVVCELICEGVHNDKRYLKWLIKLLGFDRVITISDGAECCGFSYPQGHVLSDGSIISKDGGVFRDGILRGSIHDLYDAFKMFYREFDYSILDIIKMTSVNALRDLGMHSYDIGLGKTSDIIVFDHNLNIKQVYIAGKTVL